MGGLIPLIVKRMGGGFALFPEAQNSATVVLTESLDLNLPPINFLDDLVPLVLRIALLLSVSLHSSFLKSGPQAITSESSKEFVQLKHFTVHLKLTL